MLRKIAFTLLLIFPALTGIAHTDTPSASAFKVELVPNLTFRDDEVRAGLLYDTERKVIEIGRAHV